MDDSDSDNGFLYYVITMLLLCYYYVITMLLLCYYYVITMLLLCYTLLFFYVRGRGRGSSALRAEVTIFPPRRYTVTV